MSVRPTRVAAVALLLLGVLLILYSVFGVERRRAEADLGPMEIEIVESERPALSPWIGVAVSALGALLLFLPARPRS